MSVLFHIVFDMKSPSKFQNCLKFGNFRKLLEVGLFFGAMIWGVLACGSSGDDKNPSQGGATQENSPSPVNNGKEDISGFVRIDAEGVYRHVVRVYSLDQNNYVDGFTDETGAFSIALNTLYTDSLTGDKSSFFVEGSSYSFHVLTPRRRRIGMVDFSIEDGIQGSISYTGGVGFDLGFLDISTNGFGLIEPTTFQVALTGGFQLDALNKGDLEEKPLPSYLSRLDFGRELVVGNSSDMYGMFIQRSSNPGAYSRGLLTYGGAFFELESSEGQQISFVAAVEKYDWFLYSSIRMNAFDPPSDGLSWQRNDYRLYPSTSGLSYSITANTRNLTGSYFSFVVRRPDGTLEYLNRYLGDEVVRPPILEQLNLGDASSTLSSPLNDYDGLLNFFILDAASGNVLVSLNRPAYEEEIGVGERSVTDFHTIGAMFEYYNGTIKIDVSADDFGPIYSSDKEALTLTKTPDTYSWLVLKRHLKRDTPVGNSTATCTDSVIGGCTDLIEIPRLLFLEGLTSIDRVKVSFLYEGAKTRSGSSYWFYNK